MATEGGTHSFRVAWMDALLSTPNDPDHGAVDAFARAVAFVLYRHMNSQGYARPGTRTLGRQSGASHAVVEDRLRRLEASGWLTVSRQPGKVNRYSATIPNGVSAVPTALHDGAVDDSDPSPDGAVDPPTALPDGAVDRATGWRGQDGTALSQPETAPPGGAKPLEPLTPSRTQTTHDRRKPKWKPRERPEVKPGKPITRALLWEVMAWRKFDLVRDEMYDPPPPRSRREDSYIQSVVDDFENQFDEKAKSLLGRIPRTKIELFIWNLDPTLSKHGWGPELAEADARRRREQAEHDAKLAAVTDEEKAQAKAEASKARAQIKADAASRKRQRQPRTNLDGPPSPCQVPEAS